MQKSLISIAVLAALSSTQVSAGGPSFNKDGVLDVTCVKVGDADFYNASLKQQGKSGNFLLTMVSQEDDDDTCEDVNKYLQEHDIDTDSDDDSEDDDSEDGDSEDGDSEDGDSGDDDSEDDEDQSTDDDSES